MSVRRFPSLSVSVRVFAALGILLSGLARAETVIITLKNGDRLTGELKSENADRLVLKSPLAGTVKLPKSEIAKREPLKPALAAEPSPVARPPKPAAPAPAPAVVAAPAPSRATNLTAIDAINPVKLVRSWLPSWLVPYTTNWHGSIQFGTDLGFGTTDRQTFYGNAYANHAYNRIRNTVEYHLAYGTLNGIESANRMNTRGKTDFDFGTKRRVYVYNTGGIGYDDVRRVDLEFDEGAGFGYKLVERPRFTLRGELGGQYQNINYTSAVDKSYLSIRVAENLSWKVSDKLTVNQGLTFLPNVSEFSDYRVRFELSANYPLFKRVTVSLNVIDLYDSDPPPGVAANDLTVQSTLGISF